MEKMTKKQLFTVSSKKNVRRHYINYVGKFKINREGYSSTQGIVKL